MKSSGLWQCREGADKAKQCYQANYNKIMINVSFFSLK
jgi:hypothetical protein